MVLIWELKFLQIQEPTLYTTYKRFDPHLPGPPPPLLDIMIFTLRLLEMCCSKAIGKLMVRYSP